MREAAGSVCPRQSVKYKRAHGTVTVVVSARRGEQAGAPPPLGAASRSPLPRVLAVGLAATPPVLSVGVPPHDASADPDYNVEYGRYLTTARKEYAVDISNKRKKLIATVRFTQLFPGG